MNDRSRPRPAGAAAADRGFDPARLALPAALVLGVALRLWIATRNAGLTMDSPLYVRMMEALAGGEPAIGPAHHGYPALMALLGSVLPGRELPGRALSFLAGIALIPLVFALARRLAPAWAAGLAAGLVAVHPLLAVYSGPIMTETTFLALALGALLLVERGRSLAGGLGLGLAYTVRPEALVVVLGAWLLGRGGRRRALQLLGGFALVAAPYVGVLSWERGEFTLSPKSALVRPPTGSRAEAEWRVGDTRASEPPRSLIARVRWAAPAALSGYLPRLGRHLNRLLESWPWPLAILGVVGLARGAGPAAAPLVQLLVLPLLAVGADIRFSLLFVPTLAIYGAAAAGWIVARWSRPRGLAAAVCVAAAMAGLATSWGGRAGFRALHFDDGPMAEMREAGEWLRRNGRPGATVMDRKAYVPYFAGMRHTQLPDDDYETILRYAGASGADYLVLEEFVVETMRPQLRPLLADARFRAGERRLRLLYHVRRAPHSGVVVMEVVR